MAQELERARPLPGLPEVTLQRNVPCRMRDGVTLYADVYRPAGEGPFPVILIRLPYDKTQAENITYSHPSWYAQRGYMVVVQDVRGYWASEGEFTPFLNEAEDGYDTIEWAARLPGANGRVGMYGFSYAGATQLMPATLRPPSLVTVCPALTASQYYEGWTYNQGALALAFTMSWAVNLAEMEARRAKDDEAMASLRAAFANSQGWNWYLPLAEFPPLSGKYGELFLRLAGPPHLRRLLAALEYRRGLQPPHRSRAAHRRLVRHLPLRLGQEFPRHAIRRGVRRRARRPEAGRRTLDPHALGAGQPDQ